MPDIFISYSRKDAEQAALLSELLASAGLSVWIDQSGIDVATSWSASIVDAINDCKALIVMLSQSSIESHNVIKEVSLASEKRKKILPLDLEPVTIPRELEYHLAGIQRAPMTNIDAIIRALGKLGLEATGAPQAPKIVKEKSDKKSLMVLPFQDLSPTADNGWFADGIVSELISALSNIKALRVADKQTTQDYKRYTGTLPVFAREMSIQYFVQGDVRKFGDQIKISVVLLDIESGDHLWQHAMKGTMDDIFDIQESVAEKVVEGLKVHLGSDEKKRLTERGTENAEAYELSLKANEYFGRQSLEGFKLSIQLNTEAIALDPNFIHPYLYKANTLTSMYRSFDRNPALLDEAEALCKEALRLDPDQFRVYQPLSNVYFFRGRLSEAEEAAKEYVRKDPLNAFSHANLGTFYMDSGQPLKAIACLEESIRLRPNDRTKMWNLVVSCDIAKESEKCSHWAGVAIPIFERQLKLHPDNEHLLIQHAALLEMSGQRETAYAAAMKLTALRDGGALFDVAALFARLGDRIQAVRVCLRAVEAGYKNTRQLNELLTEVSNGAASCADTPEYAELKQRVEQIEREAKTNA